MGFKPAPLVHLDPYPMNLSCDLLRAHIGVPSWQPFCRLCEQPLNSTQHLYYKAATRSAPAECRRCDEQLGPAIGISIAIGIATLLVLLVVVFLCRKLPQKIYTWSAFAWKACAVKVSLAFGSMSSRWSSDLKP